MTEANTIESNKKHKKLPFLKHLKEYEEMDKRSENISMKLLKRREEDTPVTLNQKYVDEKDGIEKRLENSDKALSELLRDGSEIITNIRIANDKREIERRTKEAELREELLRKLEKESAEASKKFKDISKRWVEMSGLKDPMGIYDGLESQKLRIDSLMQQKDEVIQECRNELAAADSRYLLDQEKQSADLFCLTGRIDQQIEIMKKTYREHLELLQDTIDNERDILSSAATEKWDTLYCKRAENEQMKLSKKKEKREIYGNELDRITLEHEELTRATRIRLEKDNQALQIELQNLKANVMLNSDKLDYNYQVLKKREDENVIIRNQQKRRLSRLNETISQMKKKISETQTNFESEKDKLTAEVMKMHRQIMDLEDKADTFSEINNKKYEKIWQMNQEEATSLLNKVLAIDRVLYEQQLGIEWEEPDLGLMDKELLPSYKEALSIVNSSKTKLEENARGKRNSVKPLKNKEDDIDTRLLRTIIRKIGSRAGFLVEAKLTSLLKPYKEEQNTLVRIDNIFNALGVSRLEDVILLKDFFLPYSWCPSCSDGPSSNVKLIFDVVDKSEEIETPITERSDEEAGVTRVTLSGNNSDSLDKMVTDFNRTENVMEEAVRTSFQSKELETKKECSDHKLVIESAFVLNALREYTESHLSDGPTAPVRSLSSRLTRVRNTVSRLIDPDDVGIFWKRYREIFTPQKERVWNALEQGLTHYLKILKERENLDNECENLRKQNTELKFLMQKYIPDQNCHC